MYNDINIGSTKLVSWTEIPGLENAAGVGSYTTTFQLSENWDNTMGAEIDLGRVQDSFRVWINDNLLPAGNRYDTVIDISQYPVSYTHLLLISLLRRNLLVSLLIILLVRDWLF